VWFPTDVYEANSPHGAMTKRLDAMTEREVRDELVAETLKLGDILKYESDQTACGYRYLRAELVVATLFVLVAAFSAVVRVPSKARPASGLRVVVIERTVEP